MDYRENECRFLKMKRTHAGRKYFSERLSFQNFFNIGRVGAVLSEIPLNPILKGALVEFLRREAAPLDLKLFPDEEKIYIY